MLASNHTEIMPLGSISQRILVIRGMRVIVDVDLAELYNVSTKRLNEQVKRNLDRFPIDFMFQLSQKEKMEVVAICDHLQKLKFSHQLPYAFTEHGVVMLSSVLQSERAVYVNIFIVRAFIKIREILSSNKELAYKIEELEREQRTQNHHISVVYSLIDKLFTEPSKPKNSIGFNK